MGGAPGGEGGAVGIGPIGGISGAALPAWGVFLLNLAENAPSFMCRSS